MNELNWYKKSSSQDIIVTTPKTEMENASREAKNCIRNGGGSYFRHFSKLPKNIGIGSKVFYVENGYVRGFAIIEDILTNEEMACDTTGKQWPKGNYIKMKADSWKWIKPIAHKGFQGFRYFDSPIEIAGDWKDKKPEIKE